MPTELLDIEPEEVSLVPDGAVAEADFVVLTKSAPDEVIEPETIATEPVVGETQPLDVAKAAPVEPDADDVEKAATPEDTMPCADGTDATAADDDEEDDMAKGCKTKVAKSLEYLCANAGVLEEIQKEQLVDLALSVAPESTADGIEVRLCKHFDAKFAELQASIAALQPVVIEKAACAPAPAASAEPVPDARLLASLKALEAKMNVVSGQYDQLTKKVGRACGQG